METLQINKQFRINVRTYFNIEQNQYSELNLNSFNDICENTFKIELLSKKDLCGQLLVLPLFSKWGNWTKQAVIFKDLNCSGVLAANIIIKEAQMLSWEMGFKVAFSNSYIQLFTKSGFEKVARIFPFYNDQHPLLFSELSWNGMNKIPSDLIFPKSISPYKILS